MTQSEFDRLLEAFRRDQQYEDDLSDLLYVHKVRVYQDTLSELLAQHDYPNEDVSLSEKITQALSDEADPRATQIADTFNRDLERFLNSVRGLTFDDALREIQAWAEERDAKRADLIAVTEAFSPHADATLSFYGSAGISPDFDFGGHGDEHPACPLCQAILDKNPHPAERALQIGTPHPQCRQNWHARVDESLLPDALDVGQADVAGIVGGESLIQRAGGQAQAITMIQEL